MFFFLDLVHVVLLFATPLFSPLSLGIAVASRRLLAEYCGQLLRLCSFETLLHIPPVWSASLRRTPLCTPAGPATRSEADTVQKNPCQRSAHLHQHDVVAIGSFKDIRAAADGQAEGDGLEGAPAHQPVSTGTTQKELAHIITPFSRAGTNQDRRRASRTGTARTPAPATVANQKPRRVRVITLSPASMRFLPHRHLLSQTQTAGPCRPGRSTVPSAAGARLAPPTASRTGCGAPIGTGQHVSVRQHLRLRREPILLGGDGRDWP